MANICSTYIKHLRAEHLQSMGGHCDEQGAHKSGDSVLGGAWIKAVLGLHFEGNGESCRQVLSRERRFALLRAPGGTEEGYERQALCVGSIWGESGSCRGKP